LNKKWKRNKGLLIHMNGMFEQIAKQYNQCDLCPVELYWLHEVEYKKTPIDMHVALLKNKKHK